MMNPSLITIAIIGFFGQMAAVIVGAYLTQRNASRAESSALKAQLATHAAQENAYKAQQQATDAARQLVIAAKSTDTRLDKLKSIAQGTHIIVNNQRTVMLRLIASLARRIATDNPQDVNAQAAASAADDEASKADEAASISEPAPVRKNESAVLQT